MAQKCNVCWEGAIREVIQPSNLRDVNASIRGARREVQAGGFRLVFQPPPCSVYCWTGSYYQRPGNDYLQQGYLARGFQETAHGLDDHSPPIRRPPVTCGDFIRSVISGTVCSQYGSRPTIYLLPTGQHGAAVEGGTKLSAKWNGAIAE